MKTLFTLAAAAGLIVTSGTASAATLFADSFNRADNTDLNAATTGKSGSLGALTWNEVSGGAGGNALIASNTLTLGENATAGGSSGYSTAYLNHNFTDALITTGGEFTVSFDLGPASSGGGTRFTGFSLGNSLANVTGWTANNPTSFASDFFFGYDPTGTTELKIFEGGIQDFQSTTNLSAAGATLSVRFFGISDFNTGSTVNYEAFVDGGSVDTGSFTWSGTNENYLNVYSNYTSNSGTLDNFAVTALIPEPSTAALLGFGGLALLRRRRA